MANDFRLHTTQTDAAIVAQVAEHDAATARRVAARLRGLRLELALTRAGHVTHQAGELASRSRWQPLRHILGRGLNLLQRGGATNGKTTPQG